MKIKNSKFDIGQRFYCIRFSTKNAESAFSPNEHIGKKLAKKIIWLKSSDLDSNARCPIWEDAGLFEIQKIKIETDGVTQSEKIWSNKQVHVLGPGMESYGSGTFGFEFAEEDLFENKEDAKREIEKRNKIMVFKIRIKGSEKIYVTRLKSKIYDLLEQLVEDKDPEQKILIEKTEMVSKDFVNLDIDPLKRMLYEAACGRPIETVDGKIKLDKYIRSIDVDIWEESGDDEDEFDQENLVAFNSANDFEKLKAEKNPLAYEMHKRTGYDFNECKEALTKSDGAITEALEILIDKLGDKTIPKEESESPKIDKAPEKWNPLNEGRD